MPSASSGCLSASDASSMSLRGERSMAAMVELQYITPL